MNNEMLDPHLMTKIVSSYVRHHSVAVNQVAELITSVHGALGRLGQPVQPQEVLIPAVSVRRSVHHDYVVCLDCGYRGKTLRRHIGIRHGLTRDDYLKRWRLKSDHPLTAPAYSERRSTMAQALGFGRKSKVAVISAATRAVSISKDADSKSGERVARRRSTRSASKSANGGGRAPSPKKARPRSRVAP